MRNLPKTTQPDICDKVDGLPDGVIAIILQFYWKIIDEEKRNIKIVATLFYLRRYTNDFLNYRGDDRSLCIASYIVINPPYNMYELINRLLNCGCCKRHSTGLFYKYGTEPVIHNKLIKGDVTNNKIHNKYTCYNRKCTCPCRHFLRSILYNTPLTCNLC